MIVLAIATALVGLPIFEKSDERGDRFAMYSGACIQGPVIAFWKNKLVFNLRAGESYPPGCGGLR